MCIRDRMRVERELKWNAARVDWRLPSSQVDCNVAQDKIRVGSECGRVGVGVEMAHKQSLDLIQRRRGGSRAPLHGGRVDGYRSGLGM
eukprot:1015297-Pyramimonas_sp.AAC.1